jgi:hypothetical protein
MGAREIDARLSRHRQAEYAPSMAARRKAARCTRLPRAPSGKTGPAGKEAESPSGKPADRRISYHREKF